MDNYCTNIGLEEEGAKCRVLRETLPTKIRIQLLFEVDYKNKSTSYQWHKEKLMLFPSSGNNLVELVEKGSACYGKYFLLFYLFISVKELL